MDQMVEGLKAIGGILIALFLAMFAKRYADLKKRSALLRQKEVEDEKHKVVSHNNSMPIDDLVDRENDRFRTGFHKSRREDH